MAVEATSSAVTSVVAAGPVVTRPPVTVVDGEDKGPRKSRQEVIAERQTARNAALAQRGGRAKKTGDERDPMDPVSVGLSWHL